MGKSFNDDIFNDNFDAQNINGLNISKEAIKENKKGMNIKLKDNLNDAKKEYEKIKNKKAQTEDIKETIEQSIKTTREINTQIKEQIKENEITNSKTLYTKKTMIFNQDYLDIIDGLAQNKDMHIKDVLNQLLGHAINQLDAETKEKALKTGRKGKTIKVNKSIF